VREGSCAVVTWRRANCLAGPDIFVSGTPTIDLPESRRSVLGCVAISARGG
jgi:hypothetical protein